MNRELSSKTYNTIIGLILLWGFAVNAIMCTFFQDVFSSWNPTAVLIGYFVDNRPSIKGMIFDQNYNLCIINKVDGKSY